MPVITNITSTATTIVFDPGTSTTTAASAIWTMEDYGTTATWTGGSYPSYAWVAAGYRPRGPTPQERMRQMQQTAEAVMGVYDDTAPARKRAQRLLEESLTPAQRESLAANGYFEVTTPGTRVTYRIHRMWSRNIQIVNGRGPGRDRWLCIHPRIATPVEDSMLAQKVMLESGLERELLETANHS